MTRILAFVASFMGFLWSGARFRITGSEVSTSNGGDALLLVESSGLRLRFTCDRTQLFLDLQSVAASGPREWYSIDLVRRLLLGQPEPSSLLDESFARFLGENLAEVERRLSAENWPETRPQLRALMAKRSKEMFGR
jgi:hypothetical protein